jgi:outer membrane protein OmpA-like peptidoglycan-associated protein
MHAHATPKPFSLRRAVLHALAISLIPLGTAYAQYAQVRITRDKTEIKSLRGADETRMWAPKDTVLEVIYIEGDRYQHRESNWYWVMLPKDPWATRPAGWVRGDKVELLALPAPTPTPNAARDAVAPPPAPAYDQPRTVARTGPTPLPERAAVDEASTAARPTFSDVVLNFEFGKSELTDDAKRTLASAISVPKPNARMSVALEGHADWVGSESYNEKLGMDRAEAVRRYLADQLRIPAGQISVVSYGEGDPAATNATAVGRAKNRRVVIKVGA